MATWIDSGRWLRACLPRFNLAVLVSGKWPDTQSVIPEKAGIQLTLLWIPAYRKDDRGEEMSLNFAVYSYLQDSTPDTKGLGGCNAVYSPENFLRQSRLRRPASLACG